MPRFAGHRCVPVVVETVEAVVNGEGAPFSTTPQGAECEEAMTRRRPYPPEFREQMVELVRSGRSPESLEKEFEPSARSIRTWVRQADLDEGKRQDGLTTAQNDELRQLRRENRRLKEERDILAKAAAWFARETDSAPPEPSSS